MPRNATRVEGGLSGRRLGIDLLYFSYFLNGHHTAYAPSHPGALAILVSSILNALPRLREDKLLLFSASKFAVHCCGSLT